MDMAYIDTQILYYYLSHATQKARLLVTVLAWFNRATFQFFL